MPKKEIIIKESSKQMQQLKITVNQQIDKMRKDFIDDGMGFRTLQKDTLKQAGDGKLVSMNLKDNVKPSYGVEMKAGDVVAKGPDY